MLLKTFLDDLSFVCYAITSSLCFARSPRAKGSPDVCGFVLRRQGRASNKSREATQESPCIKSLVRMYMPNHRCQSLEGEHLDVCGGMPQ